MSVAASALIALAGCAFLLNNVITGARNREFVFRVHLQGLPRNALSLMTKDGERLPFSSVRFTEVDFELRLRGADSTIPYVVRDVGKMFKNPELELRIVAPQDNLDLDVSGSLVLRLATETSIQPVEVREDFAQRLDNVPYGSHYLLIKFLDDGASPTARVEVLPRVTGYRFNVVDNTEGFVEVLEGANRYVFFTIKGADANPNFVFVGRRNETYVFLNQVGVQKTGVGIELDREETTIQF